MLNSLRTSRAALMAVALMGLATAPALAYRPTVVQAPVSAARPGARGLFNDWAIPGKAIQSGRKSAGISMAQQKRAASKKRNITRNRRHHR